MRDGGGRGEARPGPERRPTLADHLVSDISTFYIYNMYTMCGGGVGKDKLNRGDFVLNGFIFTSTYFCREGEEC